MKIHRQVQQQQQKRHKTGIEIGVSDQMTGSHDLFHPNMYTFGKHET